MVASLVVQSTQERVSAANKLVLRGSTSLRRYKMITPTCEIKITLPQAVLVIRHVAGEEHED